MRKPKHSLQHNTSLTLQMPKLWQNNHNTRTPNTYLGCGYNDKIPNTQKIPQSHNTRNYQRIKIPIQRNQPTKIPNTHMPKMWQNNKQTIRPLLQLFHKGEPKT